MPQGAVPVGSPPQWPAVPTGHPPAGAPTPAAFGVAGGPGIVIDAKFIPISFFYYFIKPKLVINGREVPATWNRNVVPLPPGRYHVHMHVPYLMPTRVGPVDTELIVQPGRFTQVEYRVPAWSFSPGAIGPAPQKYNGIGLTVAVTLIPLVLMLFILFLGAAV